MKLLKFKNNRATYQYGELFIYLDRQDNGMWQASCTLAGQCKNTAIEALQDLQALLTETTD